MEVRRSLTLQQCNTQWGGGGGSGKRHRFPKERNWGGKRDHRFTRSIRRNPENATSCLKSHIGKKRPDRGRVGLYSGAQPLKRRRGGWGTGVREYLNGAFSCIEGLKVR